MLECGLFDSPCQRKGAARWADELALWERVTDPLLKLAVAHEQVTLTRRAAGVGTQFSIPLWVGGSSEAAIRRAIKFGAAWHPLSVTLPFLCDVMTSHTPPAPASLQLTSPPADHSERIAGTGSLEQIRDDLDQLERLGADTVVLDPYHGNPGETRRPRRNLAGAHHSGHPTGGQHRNYTLRRGAAAAGDRHRAHASTLDAPYGHIGSTVRAGADCASYGVSLDSWPHFARNAD